MEKKIFSDIIADFAKRHLFLTTLIMFIISMTGAVFIVGFFALIFS